MINLFCKERSDWFGRTIGDYNDLLANNFNTIKVIIQVLDDMSDKLN